MCFYVHPDYLKIKIAYSDLIVFKGSEVGLCSKNTFYPYYRPRFKYEKDLVKNKIKLRKINDRIEDGYHSYDRSRSVKDFLSCHSTVGIFIIPKGSRYYVNPDNTEIVSNQIIYKGPYATDLLNSLMKTSKIFYSI